MLLYQLLRPLSYLRIQDGSKWKIDILLPIVFSVLVVFVFYVLPVRPTIFGPIGVLSKFIQLMQILPGFYLTALAAVSTFNKSDLDQLLPTPTPTVSVLISGKTTPIKLTRRRMLSMLFGYLTFICFTLYFVTLAAQIVAPSIKEIIPVVYANSAIGVFLLLFGFLVGELIFITMFGLYQLADRMHQPD